MTTKKGPVVWINGFPGSGKLTVATAVAALCQSVTLLDNHKLIDPVEARTPRSHPDYQQERKLYRELVLKRYVGNPVTFADLVIFTDFQSNNDLGRRVAAEYKEAAFKVARPFIPVYLLCEMNENMTRIINPGRVKGGTTKLTDVSFLQVLRDRCELFHFEECHGLTLDTTNMTPQDAAVKILAFIDESLVRHHQ